MLPLQRLSTRAQMRSYFPPERGARCSRLLPVRSPRAMAVQMTLSLRHALIDYVPQLVRAI